MLVYKCVPPLLVLVQVILPFLKSISFLDKVKKLENQAEALFQKALEEEDRETQDLFPEEGDSDREKSPPKKPSGGRKRNSKGGKKSTKAPSSSSSSSESDGENRTEPVLKSTPIHTEASSSQHSFRKTPKNNEECPSSGHLPSTTPQLSTGAIPKIVSNLNQFNHQLAFATFNIFFFKEENSLRFCCFKWRGRV